MDRKDIEKKVKEIISDMLYVNIDDVKDEARLREDLGADSLDCVELLMKMEIEFSISIVDDEDEEVVTVKDVIDLIERKTV